MRRLHLKYRLHRLRFMIGGVFTMAIPIFILTGLVVCSGRFWIWITG